MDPLTWVLGRLVSQDVALHNAATASIRLGQRRRQQREVDAFLADLAPAPNPKARAADTGAAHR